MVVDLDPAGFHENVILVTTNEEYKMIELKKGRRNFEQNKVVNFEKIQNNSEYVKVSDTIIMPSKDTSFKIPSKLCSRLSYDCEKNEKPWFL